MTDLTAAHITRNARRTRTGLMGYLDLYRQRRALAHMDDAQLTDLGLTKAEAQQEADRPVWDAPNHWQR
ncbi:DUF1127 domain-containing protein [uncultured Litoreibacter sp.]|uniref:DUF1127 domain-containing protein n=1 Tax=uncultured Litoreibacter sp. TaxID=1392394 RepID=UPI002632D8DA|nr:DUF1127 domain-containing protein [uncultured Litoreibacter sp.]